MDAAKRDRQIERMQAELESMWWKITQDQGIPPRTRAWVKQRRYLRDQTIRNLKQYVGKTVCDRYLKLHRQMQRLRMPAGKKSIRP